MIKPNSAIAANASAVTPTGGGEQYLYASGASWGALTLTHSPDGIVPYATIQTGVSLTANGETGFKCGTGFVKATSTSVVIANWGIDQIETSVIPSA